MRITLTLHALERWRSRTGRRAPRTVEGVLIPYRLVKATRHWSWMTSKFGKDRGDRFAFAVGACILVHNGRALTIANADDDDLATVLVWLMLGVWDPSDRGSAGWLTARV